MSEWLVYTLSILLFLDFGLLLVLIMGLKPSKPLNKPDELPFLSIILSARDEEENLNRCLDSLLKLKYDGRMEFLIGDDGSSDKTAEIIQSYAQNDQRIKYLSIEPGLGNMNGKANALSQLSRMAKGDHLIFTDADMAFNPSWAAYISGSLVSGYHMTSGITSIEGKSIFARCQNMDWLFAQGMLRVISSTLGTVTALGNNMGLRAEAYSKTGGFESLEFSLTEDHEMNKAIRRLNLPTNQEMNAKALGFSLAEKSILDWMRQRKRWMTGALQLQGWLIFLLAVHNLRWSLILIFLFLSPWAGAIAGILILLDLIFLGRVSSILKLNFDFIAILAFQFYQSLLYPISVLYFFLPFTLSWKGRKYTKGRFSN